MFPRIASTAPRSQFVFIRHRASANVSGFSRPGSIAPLPRMVCRGTTTAFSLIASAQSEFVAAQGLCDVFLDSAGWSGCNSTLESLSHDLPVVTLPGALMRGRHSAAILQMMGVTETIASTLDDYVALAAQLANTPEERQAASRHVADNKHKVYRDRACVTALEDFLERAVRGEG